MEHSTTLERKPEVFVPYKCKGEKATGQGRTQGCHRNRQKELGFQGFQFMPVREGGGAVFLGLCGLMNLNIFSYFRGQGCLKLSGTSLWAIKEDA